MASIPNVDKGSLPVKQSKKHAQTLTLARAADISTRIGKDTTAKLEVAVKLDDEGAEILEYSYVWTGSNGQQSKCSFRQGSEAVLLPPNGFSRSQLTAITFSSVQLKGSNIGTARFKIKDSEETSSVGNGAVGHRLISAYLLQSGLTTEEDIAAAFGLGKPSRKRHPTQHARAQPVSGTAEQQLRRKLDAWHEAACSNLARHPDWYEVCSEISEEGQRDHRIIKLTKAAKCQAFGQAKYAALVKRRWKVCDGCSGFFPDMKRFERHVCAAPEDAAAPESSELPAAEAVPAPASASAPAPVPPNSERATLPGGLCVQTVVPQQHDQEEGSPPGSLRSPELHAMDDGGAASEDCGASSTPGCISGGPDVGYVAPLAEKALRDRDKPLKPRGPGLRGVQIAEPILYSYCELSWGTADGTQDIGRLVPRCPVALSSDDSCAPCRISRAGAGSKHGLIGLAYPERLSGVPRFHCQEHKRAFSLLTPTVYEALPDDAVVQPELVVLTENTILRKEAWRVLAMKAFDSGGDFAKVAAAAAQQAQSTYDSWVLSYTSWLHDSVPEDQHAEIEAEMVRWGAIPSALPLDFCNSSAPAVQPEPVRDEAAGPPALEQDDIEEDVLEEVVPDDTHDGVDSLLKDIWIDKECNDLPAFYATDNIAKDRYLVADSFSEIRQERQALGLTTMPLTEIYQDIFHARERVARTLNKGHPDYYGALAGVKKLFGRLVPKGSSSKDDGRAQPPIQAAQEGPYENVEAFNKELSNWAAFWSNARRLPDESPETAILRLAKSLSENPALLQDAATVELSISAEEEASQLAEQRPGGSRIGQLPNVRYMSYGEQHLQQHSRFMALSRASVPSEIPQRTPAWHAQRAGCVTASTAAAFLGLKSSGALKDMAGSGFKVYPRREDNELGFRVTVMLAAQHGRLPPAEKPIRPHGKVAMAMGTQKEPDALLSYAEHMETIMPAHWKLRECGGKLLSALPSSLQALAPALAELPPVMASCDGIVYDSLTGEMLKAAEAKHRCPFVPSAGQAFFFRGDRVLALEDLPLEYFTQCQMQMLVQDLPHCDLISYALAGSRVFTIPRDERWLALALQLLVHLQKEYIQPHRVPEADMYSREVPHLFSAFVARTKHCMAELQEKPPLNVPSSVNTSACRMFLDDLPSGNQQRRQIEELLSAKPHEQAPDVPATPCAVEPVEVAAEQADDSKTPAEVAAEQADDSQTPAQVAAEQADDSQTPAAHESIQAEDVVIPQAGRQDSAGVSEQQPMEAQPAGRPRRTLKRPQKVMEGLEASEQQDQQEPPQSRQSKKQRKKDEGDRAQPSKLATEVDQSQASKAVPSHPGIVTRAVREAVERIKNPVVSQALWACCQHAGLVQGTSINENWHSWLARRIPILGGVRTFFMLCCLLAWQMYRFNQSVRQSKQAALEPKRKGPRLHQPREQALRQDFARAYNSNSIDRTGHRKRHQRSMHKSYDLQSMRAMGFQLAKPRAQAENDWSQGEINALLESLSRLDQGEETIHTVDPHYWLAHHGMLRSKTPKQVQNMLRYLESIYGA